MAKKYVPLFEEFQRINEISSGLKAASKAEARKKYGPNAKTMYPNISETGLGGDILYPERGSESKTVLIHTEQRVVGNNLYVDYTITPYSPQTGAIIPEKKNMIKVSKEGKTLTVVYSISAASKMPSAHILPELLRDRNAMNVLLEDINASFGTNFTIKSFVQAIAEGDGVYTADSDEPINAEPEVNEEPEGKKHTPTILGI